VSAITTPVVYYRLKLNQAANQQLISSVIRHNLNSGEHRRLRLSPNPVQSVLQLQLDSPLSGKAVVHIYNQLGVVVSSVSVDVRKGTNAILLDVLKDKPAGIYQVLVTAGSDVYTEKVMVSR
jgi:Secretion system C-terminal sorting domain